LWLFSTRGMGVPHRGELVKTTRAALWLFPFSNSSKHFSRTPGNHLFDNPATETLAGWLLHFRAVCLRSPIHAAPGSGLLLGADRQRDAMAPS
jgi:hypothetical protein